MSANMARCTLPERPCRRSAGAEHKKILALRQRLLRTGCLMSSVSEWEAAKAYFTSMFPDYLVDGDNLGHATRAAERDGGASLEEVAG